MYSGFGPAKKIHRYSRNENLLHQCKVIDAIVIDANVIDANVIDAKVIDANVIDANPSNGSR